MHKTLFDIFSRIFSSALHICNVRELFNDTRPKKYEKFDQKTCVFGGPFWTQKDAFCSQKPEESCKFQNFIMFQTFSNFRSYLKFSIILAEGSSGDVKK